MSLTVSPSRIVEESGSPLVAAPDSWDRRPLGEVATILNGFAFKSKQFVSDGGKPLVRIRDIFKDSTAVGYVGEYDARYLVMPGDLLVGMDGDFNSARWRGPEALLNQRVCKITPDPEQLDLDFLTHVLPGYLQAIHDLTSSTTVTHLSSRDVALIPIPVPAIEEQCELARLFETSSSRQQSSSRHLATARRAIKRFRQAVLAAACSGRLTADLRGPSSNGASEIPEGWTLSTISELLEQGLFTDGDWVETKDQDPDGDVRLIQLADVGDGVFRDRSSRFLTSDKAGELRCTYLRPGDVLVARMPDPLGRACIFPAVDQPAVTAVDVCVLRPASDTVDPVWLAHAINSPTFRESMQAHVRGTTRQRISRKNLGLLTLAVPPRGEQEEIVQRVDQLLALADALTQRIDAASNQVERSSQAVLAKAFRGDLKTGGVDLLSS